MQKLKARADVPRADRVGPRRNPGPDFFERGVSRGFRGKRLSDTSHGTKGSIERQQCSESSRWRRSCRWKNRDHAGWCSASAPIGFASVRLIIFSDARHATAESTCGITYGFWITKARCRTGRKIKRNSATGSSARARWRVRTWPAQCPRLITPTHDDAGLMILRRRLALRSRNHLDQNYKPPLHRFIFDGGVGAQQSETENAVGDEQAVDI